MPKLALVRHGQSAWNLENRFTGWWDADLTEKGEAEAKKAGQLLKSVDADFRAAFTSYQTRAIRTLWIDYEDFREATAGGTPTELARAWVQEWEAWVAKNDPYLQPTEAAPAAAPPAPSSAAAARVSAFQKRRSVYNARRAHNLISPRRDGAIHTV